MIRNVVLGRLDDQEAEHNCVRREMFAPLCAEIVRVQFEVWLWSGRRAAGKLTGWPRSGARARG